jgi:hypothetical protein
VPLDGLPSRDLVDAISTACTATTQETSQPWKAIAVFHHDQHVPIQRRKLARAVTVDVANAAQDLGITICTAIELKQLVNGVANRLWTNEEVMRVLSVPGRPATPPPGFRKVGNVRKVYGRASVLSVQLDEGSRMQIGEKFCTETAYPFMPETIASLQIDHQTVAEAVGPAVVGVLTSMPKTTFAKGRCVYLCPGLETEHSERREV